jgi:hypothetical protein
MPVITDMAPVVSVTVETLSLGLTTEGETEESQLVIEATAPKSVGRYNFDGSYRVIQAPGNPTDTEELYSSYVNKFGVPPIGSKIGFRAYFVNTGSGQQSPRFAAASTVLV